MNDLLRHPFLRLLVPLLVGILLGDCSPSTFPLWVYAVAVVLLPGVFFLYRRYRLRWLYSVSVYLFLIGTGFQLMSLQLLRTDYTFTPQPSIYKVRLLDKPEEKERSFLCRVRLLGEYAGDTIRTDVGNHLFLFYFAKDSTAATLRRGDELLVHARLAPPVNNGNPDEFDYARYLKRKGGTGTAYVATGHWMLTGYDASRTLQQVALDYRDDIVSLYRRLGLQGDELAVLSALTVGAREELSEEVEETYSVTGASHVLSLSGLHIGFLYALFWFLFSPIWKRYMDLKPVMLLLIVLSLWAFAFLTGLSSSVVRSVIMFSLLALASLQPERPLTLNTLAATAFLMLLYNPAWLFDVGFQLSFLAVAGIVLVQPRLYALWLVKNRFLRYVWSLLTVSVAAQLGTAPLVILYFSRFSTHFLLTNLWVIPMVSLVMYAAVLLLALTPFPMLQGLFMGVVSRLVHTQNAVLQWIEQLPYASIDHLWLDKWEVLLFYLSVWLIGYSLMRHTSRSVLASCSMLLLLVSYHVGSSLANAPQRSLVFYNVRGCPAVHCLTNGASSWLVHADSVADVSRLRRTLSPYWNRLHLEEPEIIGGDYTTDFLAVRNQVLLYGDKRICFLHDDRWKDKTSTTLLPIDYVYISRGYKGDIMELTSLFTIGTVVFDSSLSTYYRDRIVKNCLQLGISYLSLSEKGSIRILL